MSQEAARRTRTTTDEPGSSSSIPPSRFYDLVGNARRRFAIQYLTANTGPVALEELVTELAAWENDKDAADLTAEERKRVYASLRQTHLPVLEETGLVNLDTDTNTIVPAEEISEIDLYLDVVDHRKVSYSQAYLLLSAGGAGVIAGSALDLPLVGAVPTTTWAALVVGAFGVVSMVHMFHLRHMKVDSGGLVVDSPGGRSIASLVPDRPVLHPSSRAGTAVAGLVASLGAGLAMAAVFHYVMFLLPLVGSLVGQPNVVGGLAVHLALSVGFGLAFVGAVSRPPLDIYASTRSALVSLGAVYGLLLWLVVEGVLLPLVMPSAIPPTARPLYLPTDGLTAHLLYGVVLGGAYAVLGRRL